MRIAQGYKFSESFDDDIWIGQFHFIELDGFRFGEGPVIFEGLSKIFRLFERERTEPRIILRCLFKFIEALV